MGPNPQETADMVIVTEEIFNGKLHFLYRFYLIKDIGLKCLTLHKKWNFPLKISSENMTKFARNCGFGHI